MNDILIKRICKLIAMTYAIDEKIVYKIYSRLNSIDKTLKMIQSDNFDKILKEYKK